MHATAIETINFRRKREPEFRVGSADELLTDNLSAGDVVMFSRTWYKYHLPVALMIKAQKVLFDCEFDHAGIVVMQLGVPYILERTPFRGTVCRPFEDRVRNSSSAHIIVIPLAMQKELSVQQTLSLRKYAAELTTSAKSFNHSELYGFAKGMVAFLLNEVLGVSSVSEYFCPNVELMVHAWDSMNLQCHPSMAKENTEKLTLKDIHERQIMLSSAGSLIQLTENDVLIRSS